MTDDDDLTDKDREDSRIHQDQMQQRYLVWYEGTLGGLFSTDVASTLRHAEWNRDLFVEDGYPARILKLTVEDGEPVARWVETPDTPE